MADPPGKILPPKALRPPQGGQIAKPDLLTPPAAPIPRRPPTKSEDRVLMLDKQPVNLNGFYEAVPADAKTHSGFTMQVNQAGLMLVGWISETPSVVKPVTPIKTLPMLPSSERIGFAVFSAPLKPSPIRSLKAGECFVSFQWVAFARPVETINLFDLTLWGSQKGEERSGTLRLEYVLDPDYAYLGVRTKSLGPLEAKSWQITGINFKDTSKGFDPVRLIRRKLRLPYSIIRQIEALPSGTPPSDPKGQNDVLRDALIASHVCIIPESRILEILRIATKLFIYGPAGQEPDTPPSTEAALDEWLKAANNAQRRGAREKVLSALRGMHQEIAVLPYTYHREIVRDLFIDNARKVYKGDQTYYELYVQIVDEEFRDHPATADIWLEPILRLSTFPMASSSSQSFRYTLTLSPVSYLSIPKTGLPVTGGAATFAVKCELVEFEVDAQSRKKIDRVSGNPVVKTMLKELYDTSKQSSGPGLYAVTGTLGIAPTTVPPAIELFTQVGDLKYEDFTDATFSFVWIRGRPLSRLVLTPRSRRWRQAVLT